MRRLPNTACRHGAVMPLVILCLLGLFAFTALAIDFGIMAVARTQTQNAADCAAMGEARSLDGNTATNNNYTDAGQAAADAAAANTVLGKAVETGKVSVEIGSYTYDATQKKFVAQIPRATNDNNNLAKARVDSSGQTGFGKMLGVNWFNTSATATAVHRPRDVAIILDFSGSMRFDSLLGIPYTGNRTRSNNPEPVYPLFGHYSDTNAAALRNPNSVTILNNEVYGSSNVTVETPSGPPIVDAFHQHAQGGPQQKAFTPSSDAYATTPGGDNFLKGNNNTSSSYASTLAGIVNTTSYHLNWETKGYKHYTNRNFQGYTEGPRYWGKTFFMWPPDPLPTNDWRRKFFFKTDGVTPQDDNTKLWDSAGNLRPPRASSTANNYRINYNAILSWLKSGPTPFPNRLRAGRILYYDAIPNSINTSTFPPSNQNERFWKEYIDHVLGVEQTGGSGSSPVYQVITANTGYGPDYTWGTIKISAKPTGSPPRYMDYSDNPRRPKLHFWFGPMTMVDFLGNYNESRFWWPGTCHEAPLNASKLGIQAALQDMQQNHPNDFVSIMMFSTPKYSSGDSNRFNRVRGPLGRNYQRMIDSLWFPPYTIDNPNTEIRPYDTANNLETPRGMGGTCPAMGFMLAYNQFSGNTSLRTHAPSPSPEGEAGGLGRQGAQKLIIFQTDGMANTPANATLQSSGAYNSYYKIRQPGEYPSNSGTVTPQVYDIVDKICALDTAGGYSTTRKPVLIHCLAFGTLFEPTTSDPDKALALDLLQNIQYKGKTQVTATAPLPSYKMIIGNMQDRVGKLREAMSAIMQDGVQVSLID